MLSVSSDYIIAVSSVCAIPQLFGDDAQVSACLLRVEEPTQARTLLWVVCAGDAVDFLAEKPRPGQVEYLPYS